jgi:hypothetical protein
MHGSTHGMLGCRFHSSGANIWSEVGGKRSVALARSSSTSIGGLFRFDGEGFHPITSILLIIPAEGRPCRDRLCSILLRLLLV